MGLIYAESFLEHFAEARTYASQLISCAIDHEEKHIAIHQAGMIERMAGAYDKAMNLFLQEEALIEKNFPDDALARSANLYEQGYVSMKLHDLPLAEKNMLSALDFAEKSNDLISIGCAYRGLGEILKASEKAEDAAVYFEKTDITMEIAMKELQNIITPDKPREITPQLVIEVVTEHFNISLDQMISKNRSNEILSILL